MSDTVSLNSMLFGVLTSVGIYTLVQSYRIFDKPKKISALNLIQAFFYLIKILIVTMYVVFPNLNCNIRPWAIHIPQMICYTIIYILLIRKAILFCDLKHKPFILAFLYANVVCFVTLVFVGVGTSESSLNPVNNRCRTSYHIVYRQQYTIEIIIECFIALLLIRGLTRKSNSLRHATKDIYSELKENENLRIFSIFFIITLKIILSYNNLNLGFDPLALTHALDSARSVLIYLAVKRELNMSSGSTPALSSSGSS